MRENQPEQAQGYYLPYPLSPFVPPNVSNKLNLSG